MANSQAEAARDLLNWWYTSAPAYPPPPTAVSDIYGGLWAPTPPREQDVWERLGYACNELANAAHLLKEAWGDA